jgi:hypothetical protein
MMTSRRALTGFATVYGIWAAAAVAAAPRALSSEGRKTWDGDYKRVEFGSGPTVVRVFTASSTGRCNTI